MCFPCPRALSRTANAAEIARSHWLLPCRGVGDGYIQVRRSCSTEVARCTRVDSRISLREAFNQLDQAGDYAERRNVGFFRSERLSNISSSNYRLYELSR